MFDDDLYYWEKFAPPSKEMVRQITIILIALSSFGFSVGLYIQKNNIKRLIGQFIKAIRTT